MSDITKLKRIRGNGVYHHFQQYFSYRWPFNNETIKDKRDDLKFPSINFSLICRNIPAIFACGVYISQVMRYSKDWGSYLLFS